MNSDVEKSWLAVAKSTKQHLKKFSQCQMSIVKCQMSLSNVRCQCQMSNVKCHCQMSNVTVKCKMSQWQCHNVKKEMFYNIENQKAKKKI